MKFYQCKTTLLEYKDGHERVCPDCKPLASRKDFDRVAGYAALRGQQVTFYGCPEACATCNMEERGTLWLTTTEPPKSLDALLPTMDPGNH